MNALNFNNEYREFLNDVKDNLIMQLKEQNRKATGYAINSLRVVANQKLEAELRGPKYLQYLQTGIGSQPKSIGTKFINTMDYSKARRSAKPKANHQAASLCHW